jgi:hypothetical protein
MILRLAKVPIIGLGLRRNALVMAVNGGYMPLTPEAVERKGLTRPAKETEATAGVLKARRIVPCGYPPLLARRRTRSKALPKHQPAQRALTYSGKVALSCLIHEQRVGMGQAASQFGRQVRELVPE